MTVIFELGCDIGEFRRYYETVRDELTQLEIALIEQNPEHLIVWRENNVIVGHTFWHEASTDKHRKDWPRDKEDKAILRKLFNGKTEFVELHEVWLKQKYRGKGYGTQFFDFFEDFMRTKQHNEIVFYAYNPAALALCRKRGYQEICCLQQPGFEGNMETTYLFRITL